MSNFVKFTDFEGDIIVRKDDITGLSEAKAFTYPGTNESIAQATVTLKNGKVLFILKSMDKKKLEELEINGKILDYFLNLLHLSADYDDATR